MTKFQVPTIGGIRKVIKQDAAASPGTTIAEVGSGTISLAQLAQYITQLQTAQQNNTQGAGDDIYIVVGPGLSGGGSVGVVPIRLTAPIPYFGGEDGADGADGPPGAAGPKGATGNTGATGATGPAGVGVMGPAGEDGYDGEDGRPGPQGNQGPQGLQGATGPAGVGVQGQAGDDGADGDIGPPGATGPRGATGQNGAQGAAGPALYLLEDTTNDDGFCFPFGGTATVSTGTVEPFNITPDTHGTIPTGVGLGPNDEFEYGTSIDTSGARYSGASAWSWVNQGSAVTAVANGALVMTCDPAASGDDNNILLVPVSASTWTFNMKYAVHGGNGSNGSYGLIVRNSTNSRYTKFGVYNPGTFQPLVQQLINPTLYNANTLIGGVQFPYLSSEMEWLYLQVVNNATSLSYYWSLTGVAGSWVSLYSETLASWLSATTDVGVVVNRNGGSGTPSMLVDWFRQIA